jgi:hypothetical protein
MKGCLLNILLVVVIGLLILFNPFKKSWRSIYRDHDRLFNKYRSDFDSVIYKLKQEQHSDTSLNVSDRYFNFSISLLRKLRQVGIARISISSRDCNEFAVRLEPDSLWDIKRFSVLWIENNVCDKRSLDGNIWKDEGSEHKRSYGKGNGWFIYSDSDQDPF